MTTRSALAAVLTSSLVATAVWLSPSTAQADAGASLADAPPGALLGPSGHPLDDEQRKTLEAGKVLSELLPQEGEQVRKGVAIGIIAAPPQAVFKTLRDYAHFHDYMPHVASAEVVSHVGNVYVVHVTLHSALGMGDREYEQRVYDETAKMGAVEALVSRFEYTGKGNIKAAGGKWLLVPIDQGKQTLVRYENRLDPGGSIPDGIKNHAVKSGLESALEAVRKHTTH